MLLLPPTLELLPAPKVALPSQECLRVDNETLPPERYEDAGYFIVKPARLYFLSVPLGLLRLPYAFPNGIHYLARRDAVNAS